VGDAPGGARAGSVHHVLLDAWRSLVCELRLSEPDAVGPMAGWCGVAVRTRGLMWVQRPLYATSARAGRPLSPALAR
jgi:hypothetical protein